MLHQQYGLGKNIEQKFLQNFMMECLLFLDLRINFLQKYQLSTQYVGHQIFLEEKVEKKKLFVFYLVLGISK